MQKFEFQLFADYFQFYLENDSGAETDRSSLWTPEAVKNLLAVSPGVIGIGTVRNMTVPVTVEILDGEPMEDTGAWDQVSECSLEVPSGRIVVYGCTDYLPDAARINVTPGIYKARIYYGKLAALSEDGLQGEDHYTVVVWQGSQIPARIIKQRDISH